jgi:ankyrin repeat protein
MKLLKVKLSLLIYFFTVGCGKETTTRIKLQNLKSFYQHLNLSAVESRDIEGSTAFILAAFQGHTELVQALINSRRINIEAQNNYGNTAFMEASYNNKARTVAAMIASDKINLYTTNLENKTAFFIALERENVDVIYEMEKSGSY